MNPWNVIEGDCREAMASCFTHRSKPRSRDVPGLRQVDGRKRNDEETGEEMTQYNHSEAFCLMSYRCRQCGLVERIWNSRDGVTPFMCCCRSCDGDMTHIDWHLDQCLPTYTPPKGSRKWVDETPEMLMAAAQAQVDKYWDHPDMPMSQDESLGPLGRDGAARKLADAVQKGSPAIAIVS